MIDMHSHILPEIDDGSKSLSSSIEMAKEALKAGFTDVICTPHYLRYNYNLPKENLHNIYDEYQNELEKNNVNLHIYIGNEIYIDEDITELLSKKTFCTINNTKYMLIELPMNNKLHNLDDIIFHIQNAGYIPILAHPERYAYIQDDPNMLIDLIEKGTLIQSNFGSIINIYGSIAKKTIKILLKNNMIHFLATDSHNTSIYKKMNEIRKEILKVISEDKFREISLDNVRYIVENKNFIPSIPKKYKKIWIFN